VNPNSGIFGFRELLKRRAIDIVQPDVARIGGFTAAKRLGALKGLKVAWYADDGITKPTRATSAAVRAASVALQKARLQSHTGAATRPRRGA